MMAAIKTPVQLNKAKPSRIILKFYLNTCYQSNHKENFDLIEINGVSEFNSLIMLYREIFCSFFIVLTSI